MYSKKANLHSLNAATVSATCISELKPGEYVEEFVSGGPKNYAYRLMSGKDATKTVCKVSILGGRNGRFVIMDFVIEHNFHSFKR
jgi:hypothetical protein